MVHPKLVMVHPKLVMVHPKLVIVQSHKPSHIKGLSLPKTRENKRKQEKNNK